MPGLDAVIGLLHDEGVVQKYLLGNRMSAGGVVPMPEGKQTLT
jgi:hypothetical protein